jgi:TPP-dependent 2-oxoacid decarboxylase
MDRYYDTETVEICSNRYCAYCCKQAKKVVEYGSYHNNIDDEIYYNCDCEDALKEIAMKINKEKMIQELNSIYGEKFYQLRRKIRDNESNIKKLEYQIKLESLNKRYGIKSL